MIHNKYFEVFRIFLSGSYSRDTYGRELVNKVKLSQKNIALTLDEMEKEGILSSKTRGNLRHYFINKSNPLCKKYIMLAEIDKAIAFFKANPKIEHILNKIKPTGIVCVFGSYAKGTPKKDSDLDLFITGKINEKEIKKLGEQYNIEISIKQCKHSEFIKALQENEPLVNEILENHIIITGYEEFVSGITEQKWQD